MWPQPGEVLHFSEDRTIRRFVPRAGPQAEAYVWAVDRSRAPDYWFPRECPRVMCWATGATARDDRERILGPGGGERVHAVEYGWLDAIRTVRLFAYRLPADRFRPFGEPVPHAVVATEPVQPLGPPEPVGNLFQRHEQADIQLRVLTNLWPFWDAVAESTLGYSGIRLRNARRPAR